MALVTTHCSHDVDDQARSLTGWEQRYEQLSCGKFLGSAWQLSLDGGTLLHERTNRSLRERFAPPRGHYVFAMIGDAAGCAPPVFDGQVLDADAVMLLDSAREHDVVTTEDMHLMGLVVHESILNAIEPQAVAWLQQSCQRGRVNLRPEAALRLRRTLALACQEGEAYAGLDRTGFEGGLAAERDFLGRTVALVLDSLMDEELGEGALEQPRRWLSRQRMVERAVAFIQANLHNEIGIPEICAAACASRRSLQYGFAEFLQTTPLAYLRALRLNAARRRLKHNPGCAISDLAAELAFASASHFTWHYRNMFEELPSQTRGAGELRVG